ncbi:hypothetical protein CVT25_002972 [Psilocybe cyanescens]|uniref:START domain-containing protein n=1 Tax=Psilocybe cyanescens TaxID=93625 RepID=A0A409WMS3_PSICY|nr:hypothetical protein CVT25_002972 [Psilocybe cyanescens]
MFFDQTSRRLVTITCLTTMHLAARLRQSWYTALNDAEAQFRQLLTSPATEWKRLTHSIDASPAKQKGKARVSSVPELADVIVHRNSTKSGEDVYRMVLDVPTGEEHVSLEPWKAVLTTPELRQEWDPAVEEAHLIELFDRSTRISKTNYTLGWPANPRDSVTISRAFYDATTLIDITTSLPRSPDEPAYLRPSPPFVRSHVQLFSWCIQHIQPIPSSPTDKKSGSPGRIRLTCFWQHDLKALWGFGTSTAALTQQLSTMTLSLLKTVMKRGGRVPNLVGYGNGVSIERVRYQNDREALAVDYAIIPDDEEHSIHHELGLQGMDEVHALREHRRLTRSIECVLPSLAGWDVQVTMKGSSEEVEQMPWSAHATRSSSNPLTSSTPDQVVLRLTHGALTDDDAVLKVKIVIEVSGGTRGLRLNGLATKIHDLEERDPSSYTIPQKMLQDVASAVDMSIQTSSSLGTVSSTASSSNGQPLRPHPERTPAAEKSILSKVRRNYIYFSSLLQEPEAKWKRTTEAKGVSITQLDSIDPTLVVYRAEATFVGVGLWDLYGAVVSPGARIYWDKQHEDGRLLEDVNELTELWHFKTKPAWPVNGRDAVVLKTVYKSPSTIHVFSFSAEDPHLFPHIPPAEPGVIRTQVDLQGWAIEALSPTTTLLTLLEQSDPKGWTNKTSIPTQMISTLAGIGEFAIKCGGPPVVTRLAGSKANEIRYDHERGMFKVEYEPSASRRSTSSATSSHNTSGGHDEGGFPAIECEIRCDIDTWGASLDIVVDPPPQNITCLRRHRLSAEGGGLWLTLTHDSIFVDDERLLALVRRAPGKEKGLVMVNGARIQVDVEELPEHEIKSLTRQKRVKPPRIPLDQPPVMSVIRRRKAEWNGADIDSSTKGDDAAGSTSSWASAPKISSPLSRFFTYYVDQATATTQQAVAAISPANAAGGSSALDRAKVPMQYALDALAWTQEFNSKPQSPDGWTLVGDKGMVVQKKLIPEISPFIPVHKGFKVIEGVSAEEIAAVITEYDCRKTWDERYDSARLLESYGGQARTAFLVAKGGFPFRDRGFYLASAMAREHVPTTAPNAIFCVSASFSPDSASARAFSPAKYNAYALPIGRVYIDAWILETLDPYTKENYAIPSARCTRLVAVDYAGSIPAAFNSMINATMARGVLAVDAYMKNSARAALPVTRLPAPGMVLSEKRVDVHGEAHANANAAAMSTTTAAEAEKNAADGGNAENGLALGGGGVSPVGWKMRKRDENRVLLETKFDVEKKVYRSSVWVVMPSTHAAAAPERPRVGSNARRDASSSTIVGTASSSTATANAVTPRPSRLALDSPSPHAGHRMRRPSESLSDTDTYSASSDATLLGLDSANIGNSANSKNSGDREISSSLSAPTMTPATQTMPGAMIVTPAPGKAVFPSSRAISPAPAPPPQTNAHASSSSTSLASPAKSRSPRRRSPGESAVPSSGHALGSGTASASNTYPRTRQRAASSGTYNSHNVNINASAHTQSSSFHNAQPNQNYGELNHASQSQSQSPSQPAVFRGRTTSSVVMQRMREKEREKEREREGSSRNLVLLEVVVDSRMFGGGGGGGVGLGRNGAGYRVGVRARRRAGMDADVRREEGVVKERGAIALSAVGSSSGSGDEKKEKEKEKEKGAQSQDLDVPFITTLYTLPSSPLHSSSLADAVTMRHLVRVEVPSAMFVGSGGAGKADADRWDDPLMAAGGGGKEAGKRDDEQEEELGEKEGGRRKPEWMCALEGEGIVVDFVVEPLSSGAGSGGNSTKGVRQTAATAAKVWVNGVEQAVLGEKESLSGLGRDELVDDQVGRMNVLVR